MLCQLLAITSPAHSMHESSQCVQVSKGHARLETSQALETRSGSAPVPALGNGSDLELKRMVKPNRSGARSPAPLYCDVRPPVAASTSTGDDPYCLPA